MSAPLSSPRARSLAAAMKAARVSAGKGQRELARELEIPHSVLNYWENCKRVPHLEDVSAVLQALGVFGAERERILDLTKNAAEPNWLSAGAPGMSPSLAGVLDCEETATDITVWAPAVVPGLLQTEAYARAVIGGGGAPPRRVEQLLRTRMGRRNILTGTDPVCLIALIHEAALREVIGSTKAHAEQLRHLSEVNKADNVEIHVVQSGHGWHPGLAGPFVIYDFAESPSIVLLEHHSSSGFVYDEDDVQSFQSAARAVRGVAMSPPESEGLIASVTEEMETAYDGT